MAMPEEFTELATRVRNWGRWGPDDERGTVNLVTPDVVQRAAACVRTGKRFSLALTLSDRGPQVGFIPGRINPVKTMTQINEPLGPDFRASDDLVVMGLQAGTHWDALAHVSYRGTLYNGFPADTITTRGARHCGIDKVGALASRGVLLDVARTKGVERLEPGYVVTPDDLDAAEETARTCVEAGDIVLVRTGQMQLFHARQAEAYNYPAPGLGMATAAWFRERDTAAVATDTLAFEVFPFEREDLALPLHLLHLVEMGMLQGQNFDLEALAADCADDEVYEFFLDATPEPFFRACGAPAVPVAVK